MFRRLDADDFEIAASTNPAWLKELTGILESNSVIQPVVAQKKWNTIEEKLADIKERVGFSLLGIMDEGSLTASGNQKSASEKMCECKPCNCQGECKCGNKCECKVESDNKHIRKMEAVLDYINKIISSEPHLDAAIIVHRCREEDGLDFRKLPVDIDKLMKYIDSQLPKKNSDSVSYVNPDVIVNEIDLSDNLAEYYRHALGNR